MRQVKIGNIDLLGSVTTGSKPSGGSFVTSVDVRSTEDIAVGLTCFPSADTYWQKITFDNEYQPERRCKGNFLKCDQESKRAVSLWPPYYTPLALWFSSKWTLPTRTRLDVLVRHSQHAKGAQPVCSIRLRKCTKYSAILLVLSLALEMDPSRRLLS